jgi:hypothetical protein
MEVTITLPCGVIGRVAINHAKFGTRGAGLTRGCLSTAYVAARSRGPNRPIRQENAIAMKGGSKKKVVAFVFASNATGQRKTPGSRKPVRVETPFTIVLYAFLEEGPTLTILSVVCVFDIRSSLVQRISHEIGKRSSFFRLCSALLISHDEESCPTTPQREQHLCLSFTIQLVYTVNPISMIRP